MSKASIKSRPVSFRRAGIQFTRAGRVIDLAALTKDQVAAIYAEPNLEVTLLELPKKAAKNSEGLKPHDAKPGTTGKSSPAGGEPPAGAGASNNPASSGTQGVDGGGDAGKESASTDGTATTAPGSALRMPPPPSKSAKVKTSKAAAK